MTTQRKSLPATRAEKQQAVDKYPARRFPIQHEIQKLQEELKWTPELGPGIAEVKV